LDIKIGVLNVTLPTPHWAYRVAETVGPWVHKLKRVAYLEKSFKVLINKRRSENIGAFYEPKMKDMKPKENELEWAEISMMKAIQQENFYNDLKILKEKDIKKPSSRGRS
jgi:hypothetical protein